MLIKKSFGILPGPFFAVFNFIHATSPCYNILNASVIIPVAGITKATFDTSVIGAVVVYDHQLATEVQSITLPSVEETISGQ